MKLEKDAAVTDIELYEAYKRYFNLLKKLGYTKPHLTYSLIIATFINDLLHDKCTILNEKEQLILKKYINNCLFVDNCLFDNKTMFGIGNICN